MFDYAAIPTIGIQNRSTIDLGYDLAETVAALQTHLDRDFLPVWGRTAHLKIIPIGAGIDAGMWQLLIVDSADEPGAEGYHDLTLDDYPVMYVGVKDTLSAGDKIPTTICHEIDEGLVDPAINAIVEAPDGVEWAAETNDAVETDEYLIGTIPMSNFQRPAWFMGNLKPGSTMFDFMGLCTRPFEIRSGGYMSVKRHGKWTQIFGSRESKEQHAKRSRRRHTLRTLGGRHAHAQAREAARILHIEQIAQYVY
jgi:hypothetical protein